MTENQPELQETSAASTVSLASLEEGAELPEEKPRRNRRRKLLVTLLILLLLGAATTLGGYYLLRGARVDLRARQKQTEKITNGQDIKQAAFDSISSSLAEPVKPPSPIASQSPIETATVLKLNEEKNATPLSAGMSTTLTAPPEALTTHPPKTEFTSLPSKAPPAPSISSTFAPTTKSAVTTASNNQSIRFAKPAQPFIAKTPIDLSPVSKATSVETNKIAVSETQSNLPTFGAMLPVRLLGALYTLRQGTLARLELTRDLRTERWQLRRGTIFVGQVQSGARDRAYLQINGLLDPQTQTFIKLNGDVLGNDGGAGLRGKQRRLASAWMKVIERTTDAGIQIATGILNRRNSSVIVATDPAGIYRSTVGVDNTQAAQNRDFVEVPAGTTGFVLVTTLPPTSDASHFAAPQKETDDLTDEELAALLTEADPARIRAKLPHMSPALQRIALLVLKELGAETP